MFIIRRLIFDKVFGICHLTDVVIIRADPRQQRVCPDFAAGCFRQRCHHHRVVIGTGSRQQQLLHRRRIKVGKLHQAEAGRRIQPVFQNRQKAEHENTADKTVNNRTEQYKDKLAIGVGKHRTKHKRNNRMNNRELTRCFNQIHPPTG